MNAHLTPDELRELFLFADLTPEQLETKYGSERKAAIMPDAKPGSPAGKPKQAA